jgi:hypothetical protein
MVEDVDRVVSLVAGSAAADHSDASGQRHDVGFAAEGSAEDSPRLASMAKSPSAIPFTPPQEVMNA